MPQYVLDMRKGSDSDPKTELTVFIADDNKAALSVASKETGVDLTDENTKLMDFHATGGKELRRIDGVVIFPPIAFGK